MFKFILLFRHLAAQAITTIGTIRKSRMFCFGSMKNTSMNEYISRRFLLLYFCNICIKIGNTLGQMRAIATEKKLLTSLSCENAPEMPNTTKFLLVSAARMEEITLVIKIIKNCNFARVFQNIKEEKIRKMKKSDLFMFFFRFDSFHTSERVVKEKMSCFANFSISLQKANHIFLRRLCILLPVSLKFVFVNQSPESHRRVLYSTRPEISTVHTV